MYNNLNTIYLYIYMCVYVCSNPYLMMRKLEELLAEEEEAERKALAESQRMAAWNAEIKLKNQYIAAAKKRSKEEETRSTSIG